MFKFYVIYATYVLCCISVKLIPKDLQFIKDNKQTFQQNERQCDNSLIYGVDFVYSDRKEANKSLYDCLEDKYSYFLKSNIDKDDHPLPYVADGPGVGKSRFLQELRLSLPLLASRHSNSFAVAVKAAVFVNISFGNGTLYLPEEESKLTMHQSLCLRILFQFYKLVDPNLFSDFEKFWSVRSREDIRLKEVLDAFGSDTSCLVLGIDEVNKLKELDATTKNKAARFHEMVNTVAFVSSTFRSYIFAPILSGTVIEALENTMIGAGIKPPYIPLSLLSEESCWNILSTKSENKYTRENADPRLLQIVSELGGLPRALEYLYRILCKLNPSLGNYEKTYTLLCNELEKKYKISKFPIERLVAKYFLSETIVATDFVDDLKTMQVKDLFELGILRLKDFKVDIPFIFIDCFLNFSGSGGELKKIRFWNRLRLEKIWWPKLEDFNHEYILFRLSLYSFLGETEVPLRRFFSGAAMNVLDDIDVLIPQFSSMIERKANKISFRYPSTTLEACKHSQFTLYDSTLNAVGAPFDFFMFLKIKLSGKLLKSAFLFQCNHVNADSSTPQKINDQSIEIKLKKITDSVDQFNVAVISSEDLLVKNFLFVMLGNCEGEVSPKDLALVSTTTQSLGYVAVTSAHHNAFYGNQISGRLNLFKNKRPFSTYRCVSDFPSSIISKFSTKVVKVFKFLTKFK